MKSNLLKTFKLGGIHPPENKLTANVAITTVPLPDLVYIPVIQHIGAPSTIEVKKGDKVKTGTLIAKQNGFVSANIHSSVSGTVQAIDKIYDMSGYKNDAIIIKVEEDEWEETIDRSTELNKNIQFSGFELVQKISDMGIVGLGGATFPTHIKLMVPQGKTAEMLIINAVECEPYLTADHQLMLEKGEEILVGTSILMKALNVEKAAIGIENNKPDAIKLLTELAKQYDNRIKVFGLKVIYPQGAEKQLVKAITNREVPSGKLPIETGVVVQNVGTAFAVYEAVQKNKPLIDRIVTVTGKSLKNGYNLKVRIGTPISKLIELAGGLSNDVCKVVNGGPMMGKAIVYLETPVTKGTSGILLLNAKDTVRNNYLNCIKCAKCTFVCPMGLEPYLLMSHSQKELWKEMKTLQVTDCIECGSCSYECPAERPLLDYIRLGKMKVQKLKI